MWCSAARSRRRKCAAKHDVAYRVADADSVVSFSCGGVVLTVHPEKERSGRGGRCLARLPRVEPPVRPNAPSHLGMEGSLAQGAKGKAAGGGVRESVLLVSLGRKLWL